MRPGVPWNVKGIEAEAREAAQLAARRAGVSLGEYLTQLIMTEGRPGGGSSGYSQAYQQAYQPGDGTYGPQPMPQYQPPVPSLRYPHAVPQAQPQSYSQAFQQHIANAVPQRQDPQQRYEQQPRYDQQPPRYDQQARYEPQQQPRYDQQPQQYPQQPQGQPQQQHDPQNGPAQQFDNQLRGSEFAVVAHGLRDMADRLESSERRAQTAIATVNQSVAAMQDRIDAAERVKHLADVAFTSAADALAQSARDQVHAFESLESTVRSVQKRMNDIEAGNVEWPSKDAIGKLEGALGQLQKRLGDLETSKPEPVYKDALGRLEVTLGQLQKRLGEIEQANAELPNKDALTRLETWINDVRHDVADSEKRSREDISQLAKFMRELGTRVDTTEKTVAQVTGATKNVNDGVSARLDALEARSSSIFDEMRGQLSSIDGRLAQTSAAKNAVQPEQFSALKKSVEGLSERVEQNASKGGVHPEAFAALKRSVDTLSSTFDGLTERLDLVSDPVNGPLAGSLSAIGSTLEALTTKIEDGERRAADSVSTMSGALKTISTRLDDSDKKQTLSLQTINRRFDEIDRGTAESSRAVEDSLKALTQRLEVSDKKHKEAIGGLRLTVDGLVAKAAAEALPLDSHGRHSAQSSAPNLAQPFAAPPPIMPPPAALDDPPEFPPFSTTTAKALSGMTPPPPSFMADLPPKPDDGFSVSALQTIMAGTLSSPPPTTDLPDLEPESFEPASFDQALTDATALDDDAPFQPKKDDFLSQARRAAKAAAEAEADRVAHKRPKFPLGEEGQGRKVGRLVIVAVAGLAVIAGIIALLFTIPGGGDDEINRPDPGASIGEILNGPATGNSASASSPAEFAPPSAPETASGGAASVAVEPNGLGVPTSETPPASFTAGTSALPGGAPLDTTIAGLEAGAVRGDVNAQFLLGLRYAEGRGVTKDDAKAASLVTKAAQQGLVVAEYRLGAIYERGVGVPKDLAQAKTWYERAAKGGNRKAMHNLAVLFADGTGVGQNFQEAARWFREGADYGLADSQYNLGILLERGMGTEKNTSEAAKWYAIAASQGDSGAAERLEQLKKTMSAADVALSLEAARKFQPKPMNPTANEAPAFAG